MPSRNISITLCMRTFLFLFPFLSFLDIWRDSSSFFLKQPILWQKTLSHNNERSGSHGRRNKFNLIVFWIQYILRFMSMSNYSCLTTGKHQVLELLVTLKSFRLFLQPLLCNIYNHFTHEYVQRPPMFIPTEYCTYFFAISISHFLFFFFLEKFSSYTLSLFLISSWSPLSLILALELSIECRFEVETVGCQI